MMHHLLKGQDAGKIDRIFARLDVNADSSVTLEEWHRAIDANNDGRISAEEYKAFLSSTVSPKDATDAAMRRAAARATALAPASMNSTTSSPDRMPPHPTIGRSGKARATSQTHLRAIGLIGTPE